jgi:hypothetical protein
MIYDVSCGDNTDSCEIFAVTRFLHAKNMSAAEIHREICVVYGQNIMSEGTVRQWCRTFKDGRTNVHDEDRNGRLPVVSDNLVQSVDQKNCERRRFTISELSREFPQMSCTLLYDITARLGYHKFEQDGFQKCSWVFTKHGEWLQVL